MIIRPELHRWRWIIISDVWELCCEPFLAKAAQPLDPELECNEGLGCGTLHIMVLVFIIVSTKARDALPSIERSLLLRLGRLPEADEGLEQSEPVLLRSSFGRCGFTLVDVFGPIERLSEARPG